jgi:hypothetical protein
MSFALDDWYVLIIEGWDAPAGFRVCAEGAASELRRIAALETFDSVQLIPTSEYEFVPEPGDRITLVYTPDEQQFTGQIYRLQARPATIRALMQAEPPKP